MQSDRTWQLLSPTRSRDRYVVNIIPTKLACLSVVRFRISLCISSNQVGWIHIQLGIYQRMFSDSLLLWCIMSRDKIVYFQLLGGVQTGIIAKTFGGLLIFQRSQLILDCSDLSDKEPLLCRATIKNGFSFHKYFVVATSYAFIMQYSSR